MWRRAHQSVAARCRKASRATRRDAGQPLYGEATLQTTAIGPEEARLTNEQWALVRPLLPLQRGETGRPPNDHRRVLGGILWVARTGSSWREMPEEYGKWESAYRRHELWVKQGLWQRILRIQRVEKVGFEPVVIRNRVWKVPKSAYLVPSLG